ncbi:lymphocyte cytosolic protein 2 isoform X1 [Eleginops maclovinus]|uniref:lymphocyte cytosolic protein 2 isoform X1 n=1 Tax=Eleginops maclovinus TaxID=56733 RepID=UPI003080E61A
MSLNNVPSKADVMGWNQQSLATYLRKLKLSGCDKLVIKSSITGAHFLKMTACDLQMFPSLYVSLITKLQCDINKGEQRRASGQKPKAIPKPVLPAPPEEDWDSDEFDCESDPDHGGGVMEEDGYICALSEPQDEDDTYEESYETAASVDTVKPPPHPRVAKLQHCQNKDSVPEPIPAERKSKAPNPPLTTPQPNLHVNRSNKPSQTEVTKSSMYWLLCSVCKSEKATCCPHVTILHFSVLHYQSCPQEGSAVKAPEPPTARIPKPRIPKPTNVFRISKCSRAPPVPTQPTLAIKSIPEPTKGLDPSWYGGKMTRHEAEAALRDINKDGAFVVRDSSQGTIEHPFTLMLLKQDKVYNIMIRNKGNSYSLGTGLRLTKSFPGVKEMINYHTHTPLLLIDATHQKSEAENQCCLLHPAGL